MKAYFLFKAPGNSTLFKKVSLEEVLETWIFLGQCGHAAWGAACGGLGRGPRCGKGPCARPGSTMVPGATTSAPGGGGARLPAEGGEAEEDACETPARRD